MALIESTVARIDDRSQVGQLRREAERCARWLNWDERGRGEAGLVATELATNLLKHASEGVVTVSASVAEDGERTLLFVAVDRGPGMVDVERCLVDGYSTSGSPGTGLGAVRRLAQRFDIDSSAEGTVIVAELRRGERAATSASRGLVAAFAVPKEGQSVNGDAWAWRPTSEGMALLVCDGLGHGLEAATAASRAVESFAQSSWRTPREALEHINDALGATRGAAAAVVVLDRDERRAHFCGLGNTTAAIVADGAMKHLVSHNGILGTPRPRLVEFEYAWPQNATVLLHSDGLSGRWSPSRWPELWSRHPALIAGTLYRDCARGTDDVVVVVAREHGNAA